LMFFKFAAIYFISSFNVKFLTKMFLYFKFYKKLKLLLLKMQSLTRKII